MKKLFSQVVFAGILLASAPVFAAGPQITISDPNTGETVSVDPSSQAGGDASENGPMGPAPNSGDGVPDGSGIEAPNGPNR
ncbi:MAG: hypothetical protein OQK67_07505 [Chlorobium sp.]|nr:hypothetical protein [Chlorobium sp.]MCW8815685.1 hypothetical protein [Chlorobium sp.]MCW8819026.1 hypothetical protein [Ignavibacteriaceae bacterium]